MSAALEVETAVVGGGPAGLLCALMLAEAGRSVALIERGGRIADSLCPKVAAGMRANKGDLRKAERFRDQCGRCSCLQGMGGAAMHFDSNLGYVRSLSRPKIERAADGGVARFNTLERLLGSAETAGRLIARGYGALARFGLNLPAEHGPGQDHAALIAPDIFAHTDTADSLPAPLTRTLPIVGAMEHAFETAGGRLLLGGAVVGLEPGAPRRWRVEVEAEEDMRSVAADNVVLAVGKVAMPWVGRLLGDLDVAHGACASVDVGVRLETLAADMAWMTRTCHYPKLTFLSARGEAVRTFCVCAGGRMMQYDFAGAVVLDGQHCIAEPTARTNFGIVTTARGPDGTAAAAFALDMAKAVNRFGRGGPLVQTVGDFLADRPTATLDGAPVTSSLLRPALGNLRACLPGFLVADVLDMIARLNALSPGAVQPYALLAAPVVERAFPAIALSPAMESSRPGLFFAGDCSGKIIGVTYAMATGLRVGDAILGRAAA